MEGVHRPGRFYPSDADATENHTGTSLERWPNEHGPLYSIAGAPPGQGGMGRVRNLSRSPAFQATACDDRLRASTLVSTHPCTFVETPGAAGDSIGSWVAFRGR